MMRIVGIREGTVSLRSEIQNAWISFAQMDASIVAVATDVVREGRPVVGCGFSSNGRYCAGGIPRARMIPRLLAAEPPALVNESDDT